jgi:hypothetical protein
MYHLSNLKNSLLMGDLLSLPIKNLNLILYTTNFEVNLSILDLMI